LLIDIEQRFKKVEVVNAIRRATSCPFLKNQGFSHQRLRETPCFEEQRDKVYTNLGRKAGKYCNYFREKGKAVEGNLSERGDECLKEGLWTSIG